MQYFSDTDDDVTRIGKVIGDILAALVYLGVLALILISLLR